MVFAIQNASQEATYEAAAGDIVQSVLDGYNGTSTLCNCLVLLLFIF